MRNFPEIPDFDCQSMVDEESTFESANNSQMQEDVQQNYPNPQPNIDNQRPVFTTRYGRQVRPKVIMDL
ncbi:hypothetical protein DPMN_157210 [Dreissena polymorpha]|uniref:Uncharacterized protein n=1 Tax=Dreissena polymorpha TaxID=45954 RepID=A0A9D4INN1_DREPO|nr:hypothetical protein DPMN_157210 [Dreissena polymorpha]